MSGIGCLGCCRRQRRVRGSGRHRGPVQAFAPSLRVTTRCWSGAVLSHSPDINDVLPASVPWLTLVYAVEEQEAGSTALTTRATDAAQAVPSLPRTACAALVALLFLGACNGVLPRSVESRMAGWQSFDQAKAAFDRIEPNATSAHDLAALGFDPVEGDNIRMLNYLELQQRFLPNPSIQWADLDPNVRSCLQSHARCRGLEARPTLVRRDRVGNPVLDVFNFRREIEETGWAFDALILLQDDKVLYKTWGGSPRIREHERKDNPLGPLQDLGGFAADRAQAQL